MFHKSQFFPQLSHILCKPATIWSIFVDVVMVFSALYYTRWYFLYVHVDGVSYVRLLSSQDGCILIMLPLAWTIIRVCRMTLWCRMVLEKYVPYNNAGQVFDDRWPPITMVVYLMSHTLWSSPFIFEVYQSKHIIKEYPPCSQLITQVVAVSTHRAPPLPDIAVICLSGV